MSTSETGELCSLTQVLIGLPDAVRARAPASRTTPASAFANGNRFSLLRIMVLFSGQPAIGHSVDLVNGRRFFAAPPSPPSRRYFDRFDRLLEGSSQTIDFASTLVP